MKKTDSINSKKISIIFPFVPPTINKYIGRSNIWEYQSDKKKIHEAIKTATAGKIYNIEKCKMTITYFFKDRRRHDPSNYDKMVLDGLVEANIILDDNYSVIKEFTTIGDYDKNNPKTKVDIEILE